MKNKCEFIRRYWFVIPFVIAAVYVVSTVVYPVGAQEPQMVNEIINITHIEYTIVDRIADTDNIVYRDIYTRQWESVEQFTAWYDSQNFTLLFNPAPRSDCDDYAQWVQERALR
jgi:hypothetical protein